MFVNQGPPRRALLCFPKPLPLRVQLFHGLGWTGAGDQARV